MQVDQEDRLMVRMKKLELLPKICTFVFVFHFKSVTVKVNSLCN
jgi:hypothetical protein